MQSIDIKPMRDAILEEIFSKMHQNEDIFFVSADFGSPVLDKIREEFPSRFTNVGIAEQNLINVSAGLALEGCVVFAYAIAPFVTMRCLEQIRVNLGLTSEIRDVNVNLLGVGAGYSYVVSGPTHQCYEDISIMGSIANISVFSPSDSLLAASLVDNCIDTTKPKYLRLDAEKLPLLKDNITIEELQDGFRILEKGQNFSIISTGYACHIANKIKTLAATAGINCNLIDLFNIKNFNNDKLAEIIKQSPYVCSVEEAFIGCGGLDSIIKSLISNEKNIFFEGFGIPQKYSFSLGTRNELHSQVGLNEKMIWSKIQNHLNEA